MKIYGFVSNEAPAGYRQKDAFAGCIRARPSVRRAQPTSRVERRPQGVLGCGYLTDSRALKHLAETSFRPLTSGVSLDAVLQSSLLENPVPSGAKCAIYANRYYADI